MKLKLTKEPKNPTIIEGFPGFGLVGTISTEFLIEHLKCEEIGKFWFEDLPATIAIHNDRIVSPVGIFYNEKNNIVIIHSISAAGNIEWKAADLILGVANALNAKEIISIEGVGSGEEKENPEALFYTNQESAKKKFKDMGLEPLKEGIIIGVTSALIMKNDHPLTCIFAETQSNLPDSKASAKVIEVLDKYLGLNVNYEPLLKQAEQFEEKLKGILSKSSMTEKLKNQKTMSYVG